MACQMITECAVKDSDESVRIAELLRARVEQLQKKQRGLRSMCAMGDISREEFLNDNQEIQQEMDALASQINDIQTQKEETKPPALDIEQIRRTLSRWVDFSGPVISEELVDQFVLQVVVVDDDTYNWTLDLSADGKKSLRPSEIALQTYRAEQQEVPIDTVLSKHVTDPQELFSFTISKEEAAAYCHSIGMKFFGKKWVDKTVIISI